MLKDFLKKEFYGLPKDGEHTFSLTGIAYVSPNKEKPENDYLEMTFRNAKLTTKRNFFERDLSFFINGVRTQLDKQEETVTPETFMRKLIDNETEIKVWIQTVSYTNINGDTKQTQNWFFREPVVEETTSTDSSNEDL